MNIIMNEVKHVKDILKEEKYENITLMELNMVIDFLVNYHKCDMEYVFKKSKELVNNNQDMEWSDHKDIELHKRIKSKINKRNKLEGTDKEKELYLLSEIDSIPINEDELIFIRNINDENIERIVFCALVIGKYNKIKYEMDKIRVDNRKSIFLDSLTTIKAKERNKVLRELFLKDIISLPKGTSSKSIYVNIDFEDTGANEVIKIEKMNNNYVYQYLQWKHGKGYKQCEDCGDWIKKKGKRDQYCNSCGEEFKRESTRKRVEKYRKNQM